MSSNKNKCYDVGVLHYSFNNKTKRFSELLRENNDVYIVNKYSFNSLLVIKPISALHDELYRLANLSTNPDFISQQWIHYWNNNFSYLSNTTCQASFSACNCSFHRYNRWLSSKNNSLIISHWEKWFWENPDNNLNYYLLLALFNFPSANLLSLSSRQVISEGKDYYSLIFELRGLLKKNIYDIVNKDIFSQLYWVIPTIDKKLNLSKQESLSYLKSFNDSSNALFSILENGTNKSYHNNLLLLLNQDELKSFEKRKIFIKKINNYACIDFLIEYILKELIKKTHFLNKVTFQQKKQRNYLKQVRLLIASFNNVKQDSQLRKDRSKQYQDKYWNANKDNINRGRREKYWLDKNKNKNSCEKYSNTLCVFPNNSILRTIKGDIDSWVTGTHITHERDKKHLPSSNINSNPFPPFLDTS